MNAKKYRTSLVEFGKLVDKVDLNMGELLSVCIYSTFDASASAWNRLYNSPHPLLRMILLH